MSKILKVVDGKHYVEGGPECEQCDGEGEYYYCEQVGMVKCEDCHRTGLQPVEQWSDARKAEWLKKNNPTEGVLTISPSTVGWGVWFYMDNNPWDGEDPIYAPNGDDAWGEAEDFSVTLTAAVIAVAEE